MNQRRTVFTNGCFDILHPGHIDLLKKAKALGDYLIVGINSDQSVRQIKGLDRPFFNETDRAEILNNLESVDEVRVFNELTPARLIEEIKPDVLVKGGDWEIKEIVGAEFVKENGGTVCSIPLREGFSSSRVVEKIREEKALQLTKESKDADDLSVDNNWIKKTFDQHLEIFQSLKNDFVEQIENTGDMIWKTLSAGKKILICGNGGSAADAQHIATEFVGRYETERRAFPAIALTTDTSALTAIANDYDFEKIFARQVEALAAAGDCLIAISTSGNSPNVLAAVMQARKKGCKIIGLTGAQGRKLSALSDACLMIPSNRTARIQEAHILIAHIWCELVDKNASMESVK